MRAVVLRTLPVVGYVRYVHVVPCLDDVDWAGKVVRGRRTQEVSVVRWVTFTFDAGADCPWRRYVDCDSRLSGLFDCPVYVVVAPLRFAASRRTRVRCLVGLCRGFTTCAPTLRAAAPARLPHWLDIPVWITCGAIVVLHGATAGRIPCMPDVAD